jgi:hypothetical protein
MLQTTPAYKGKGLPDPAAAARRLVPRGCATLLAKGWLLQGLHATGRKELAFRLAVAATLGMALLHVGLLLGLPWPAALATAALGAHSLGFLLSGQVWLALRHCRLYRGDRARLDRFLAHAAPLLRTRPWLDEAVLLGSSGRGRLGDRSDIDLRLVFPPGIVAWLRVNLLCLKLRIRALLCAVPLDLCAYDGLDGLTWHDPHDPLVIVLDRRGRLVSRFAERDLKELA